MLRHNLVARLLVPNYNHLSTNKKFRSRYNTPHQYNTVSWRVERCHSGTMSSHKEWNGIAQVWRGSIAPIQCQEWNNVTQVWQWHHSSTTSSCKEWNGTAQVWRRHCSGTMSSPQRMERCRWSTPPPHKGRDNSTQVRRRARQRVSAWKVWVRHLRGWRPLREA